MRRILNRLSEFINHLRIDPRLQLYGVVVACIVGMFVLLYVYSSEAKPLDKSKEQTEEITTAITPTMVVANVSTTSYIVTEPTTVKSTTTPTFDINELLEEREPIRENTLYYVFEDDCSYYLDTKYQDYLWKKLKEYNHTELYELCIALMYHESEFKTDVISDTNDHGLMQVNISNYQYLHDQLGIESLDDPYENIDCGVFILVSCFEKYGTIEEALVAYNQGFCGNVKSTKYSQCILQHDMDCLHILFLGEPN